MKEKAIRHHRGPKHKAHNFKSVDTQPQGEVRLTFLAKPIFRKLKNDIFCNHIGHHSLPAPMKDTVSENEAREKILRLIFLDKQLGLEDRRVPEKWSSYRQELLDELGALYDDIEEMFLCRKGHYFLIHQLLKKKSSVIRRSDRGADPHRQHRHLKLAQQLLQTPTWKISITVPLSTPSQVFVENMLALAEMISMQNDRHHSTVVKAATSLVQNYKTMCYMLHKCLKQCHHGLPQEKEVKHYRKLWKGLSQDIDLFSLYKRFVHYWCGFVHLYLTEHLVGLKNLDLHQIDTVLENIYTTIVASSESSGNLAEDPAMSLV